MDSSDISSKLLNQTSESLANFNKPFKQSRIPKWLIGFGKLLLGIIGIILYYSLKNSKHYHSTLYNIIISFGLFIFGIVLFYNGYIGYKKGVLYFTINPRWQINFWKLNTRKLSIISMVSGISAFILGFFGMIQLLFSMTKI